MTKSFDMWVYHATEEPMIIPSAVFDDFKEDGWADSPAAFVKTTDFGIDPDDQAGVQALGESIDGVKNAANGAINISKMKKAQLVEYAKVHLSETIDSSKPIAELREEVLGLLEM